MQKTCKSCTHPFEIPQEDLDFYKRISPTFAGKTFQVPPPNLCPPCRQQLRMSFRNERKLYSRPSSLSDKTIVATHAPDKPWPVYDQEEWWSDSWNELEYSQDFDFNKTLAEQFQELYTKVPHISLVNTNTENSYYTNFALNQKNCYLIFGAGDNEDCLYGKYVVSCKDCTDILSTVNCELCYESIGSEKCYNCRYLKNCRACNDCTMIEDCTGCKNCIACFGLRFKEHCYLNKQYSPEEFKRIAENYAQLTHEKIIELKTQLTNLKKDLPHIWAHIYASEDCSGDLVSHCKNTKHSFNATNCEDCKYLAFTPNTQNSHDCTYNAPIGPEYSYNMNSTAQLKDCMCNFLVWYGNDIRYSIECHHSSNLFACTGMRHKQYCILNKQYSKEDYEILVARIIEHMITTGEWGEYHNKSTSPYAYNETIAQEYFPLTREEALKKGWTWKDEPPQEPQPQNPQQGTLVCKKSNRQFRLTPQEVIFYKRMGLPTPDLHHDERHDARMSEFNPLNLWTRQCSKCQAKIETNYSPNRPETIYCEKCYLAEVY